MKDKCPKCYSANTVLISDIIENIWFSRCKKCGYESKPTKSYYKALKWKPDKVADNR